MSKQYNIRWSEADNKELARVVKNYNAKVKRLEEKTKALNLSNDTYFEAPQRVSVKELKELIGTRRDLNRELNSLKRFSKRGSEEFVSTPIQEYGNEGRSVKITKWQMSEMNRRKGTINRMRKDRYEMVSEIPVAPKGKSAGYTVVGMGDADLNSLNPVNVFTDHMDKYGLRKKVRSLRKHSQSDYFNKADQRLLNNYTRALQETYGENETKDIIEAIEKMGFKDFYKTFKSNPGAFELAYPPDEDQKEAYLNEIRSTWIPNHAEE